MQTSRGRWALAAVFAVHGSVAGSFAVRIPWIQDRLELTPASLGLALLMPAAGAVTSMPFSGRLVHRIGSRAASRRAILAWTAVLAAPAAAPRLPVLCAVLFFFGVASGMSDVAMNAQAVAVEKRLGYSVMSGLHGMWSAGGILGSGVGAAAAHAGVDARLHLGLAAAVLLAAGGLAAWPLSPTPRESVDTQPPRLAIPTGPVLAIALVAACALFAEGAAADWSVVYVRRVTGAEAGLAATAYTTFALMMATGRFAGDAAVRRLGPVRTVRIGGLCAAAGGVLVVAARAPVAAILGFGLVGVGIATVIPLAFAAAGHAGTHPGHAIASVATVAYFSGMVAPAVIGGIAAGTSLRVSFALVTTLVAIMVFTAQALRTAATNPDEQPALSGHPH